MKLADVQAARVPRDALARVPLDVFARLGARLRELDVASAREDLLQSGRGLPVELRAPLRRRALRARDDDAAIALRLFCFDDAVPADDVARVLGALITGALLGCGALVRHATAGVRSLLVLSVLDDLLLLGDPLAEGGDAVMALGATTTALCRAAVPSKPVGRVLDVGTGAGAAALYLARHATSVVGVDINPRAATFGRINAALGGIANVEFRTGDLFAPIGDERFDLVVSQPPFVAQPKGAPDATYLYGGSRGDELARRLLRDLPAHLAEDGRALVLTSWPRDDRPVTVLTREALGEAGALLSLEVRDASIDEVACAYAAAEGHGYDEAYAARVQRLLRHLESMGVTKVTQSLLVVGPGSFTSAVALSSPRIGQLSGPRIEARFAAEQLLLGDTRSFLRTRLRLAEGVTLDRVFGAKGAPPRLTIEHPSDPLVAVTELNAPTLELLREIDRADDVGTAMALVSARHKLPRDKTLATLLPIAQNAVRQGVLVLRA